MGDAPAAPGIGGTSWRHRLDRRRQDRELHHGALRVLAWTAFVNRAQNPYNALLYDALTALGVRVDDFTPLRLIFGRYQIWHVHWPESILKLPRLWQAIPLTLLLRFLLVVARARGSRSSGPPTISARTKGSIRAWKLASGARSSGGLTPSSRSPRRGAT